MRCGTGSTALCRVKRKCSMKAENQIPISDSRVWFPYLLCHLCLPSRQFWPLRKDSIIWRRKAERQVHGLEGITLSGGRVWEISHFQIYSQVLHTEARAAMDTARPLKALSGETHSGVVLQLPGGWLRGRKAKYNFQLCYKTHLKVHR